MRYVLFLLVMLMTAACGSLNEFLYGPELPEVLPITPTFTPTPTIIVTAAPVSSGGMCAYSWASQLLPELDTKLESQFAADGLSNVSVDAIALGENCNRENQAPVFGHMSTNLEIHVTVDDISDQAALNPTVRQILSTLSTFTEDELEMRPTSNKLTIIFHTASEKLMLSGTYRDAMSSFAQSQDGDDLFPMFAVSVVPL